MQGFSHPNKQNESHGRLEMEMLITYRVCEVESI